MPMLEAKIGLCGGNIYSKIVIEGKLKLAMIDTGANRNILNYNLYKNLGNYSLREHDTIACQRLQGNQLKFTGK